MDDDRTDPDAPLGPRPARADARRNTEALLRAALRVFLDSGVDAPAREVARAAGVGVGTLYRHFPQRADLVAAVFRQEIDACADAAPLLAAEHPPGEALALWIERYAAFLWTKRGLAAALHSGEPAYDALPALFEARLRPALEALLAAAVGAGAARPDIDADLLIRAVGRLCLHGDPDTAESTRRMVALLVDGLRHGATRPEDARPT